MSSFWNKLRYSMDIITLRNNVLGKTANGKTLCAFLVYGSICRKALIEVGDQGVIKEQRKNLRKA